MIQEAYRGTRRWSRNAQAVATTVWISFLSAAAGTMLMFAFLDPVAVGDAHGVELSREAGYAVGFFSLWLLTASAAGVTAWLVRTAPKREQ